MTSLSVLFGILLPSVTVAQEEPPPRDATFEDLRKGLSKLEEAEEKKKEEARRETVQRNNQETLAIYDRVLRKRTGDLANVTRRLEVNRALEAKYAQLLEVSRGDLALLRSRYVNRTLALKQSLETGKISQEAYAKLLQEDGEKFRNREVELKDDIRFHQEELEVARNLTAELALKKELLEFDPFEPEKPDPDEAKESRRGVADRVRSKIRSVARYQDLSVVDTFE